MCIRDRANEAFAAQACAVNQGLGWDTSKVNVNGGAIAIGHPIGASGARVLTTLVHEMQRRDAQQGLAPPCLCLLYTSDAADERSRVYIGGPRIV